MPRRQSTENCVRQFLLLSAVGKRTCDALLWSKMGRGKSPQLRSTMRIKRQVLSDLLPVAHFAFAVVVGVERSIRSSSPATPRHWLWLLLLVAEGREHLLVFLNLPESRCCHCRWFVCCFPLISSKHVRSGECFSKCVSRPQAKRLQMLLSAFRASAAAARSSLFAAVTLLPSFLSSFQLSCCY